MVQCYQVLIETLWNVKMGINVTPSVMKPVLIETLWNVKIIVHIAL